MALSYSHLVDMLQFLLTAEKRKISDVFEPADQFGRRFFYSGNYQTTSNELAVTPENASEDFLIGETAIRAMSIDGDLLTLTGTNGSKFVAKWRKARSFVGL